MVWFLAILAIVVLALVALTIHDLRQTKHAILRNYPVVGHVRYLLERIGPELRQYIVTDNEEERPFNRDQRRWVYASAKRQNSYFGFGTDSALDAVDHIFIRQSAFPFRPPVGMDDHALPSKKKVGEFRERRDAFIPESVVNISAMSFGSLSGPAIEALNRGASAAGCLHNTGEGGVSKYHRMGGDLILQLGTGYFGAREHGKFSLDTLLESVASAPVKAIEIKLSQGAKPGLGGVLPGAKVTEEIAEARGVPVGITVESPAFHREFSNVSEMIDFVELIADATGKPVGIKSAVGQLGFWRELSAQMAATGRGPDFIAIDGGEGGTGAAPLVFSDHVAMPFRQGFAEVYRIFAEAGVHERVVWIGSGKLGFPAEAVLAMALGVDLIYVGREAMLAVGCIQAQKCHTGHCPTGVATQDKRLIRGLDPTDKADRTANYIASLRYEMVRLAHACGVEHPSDIPGDAIELLSDTGGTVPVWERYGYDPAWRRTPVQS